MVQDSGIQWGLGSDATAVTPSSPFLTLWYATTGRMLGGRVVLKQRIDRVEALIAHTRSNGYFMFQENNIGSIRKGMLADMVVLDRDYLGIAADDIRHIRPRMTIVGGKIVFQAKNQDRKG